MSKRRITATQAAKVLGRKGGKAGKGDAKAKGAHAMRALYSDEELSEMARAAAKARWGKRKK